MQLAKNLLETIVKTLVENPNEVEIESKVDEMGVLLTVHVSKMDMGMLIGKSGTTIELIRSLVKLAGRKEKSHVSVKIAEPDGYDDVHHESRNNYKSRW